MKCKQFLLFLIPLFSIQIGAQSTDHSSSESDPHEHHKNEIGIANSPLYFIKEKAFAYSLHMHYIRSISNSKFGIGLGYEIIFDEHKHNSFGIVGSYRPLDQLSFMVSPGLTFEFGDQNPNANLALHFEISYEFEIGNFHLGPTFEFAYDPEDYHISLGLHLGYGF